MWNASPLLGNSDQLNLTPTISLSIVLTLAAALTLFVCCLPPTEEKRAPRPSSENIKCDFNLGYIVCKEPGKDRGLPIIVWWTTLFYPHNGDKYLKCGDVSCYVTTNRSFALSPDTRGFVFYGTGINVEDLPLPRLPRHEWALYHEESPLNKYILSHESFIKLFNHTATFRSESDFPLTSQFIYRMNYFTERQPVPLKVKNEAKVKESLAPVLYVQSNCEAPSDRDRYVKELMKYINVDAYGECLHNKDFPKGLQNLSKYENHESIADLGVNKFNDLIARYKFHLAFENAICKDYMTEKLMRTIFVGSIPIYRGSSNAVQWMPNNKTVIMADDFANPKALAAFIKKIDGNDTEYESYIKYKINGVTNEFLRDHLKKRTWHPHSIDGTENMLGFQCLVCNKIHERINNEKSRERDPSTDLLPPKMADGSHMGCPQPRPSVGDSGGNFKHDTYLAEWVERYWQSFDDAQSVRDMILANETNPHNHRNYLHTYLKSTDT